MCLRRGIGSFGPCSPFFSGSDEGLHREQRTNRISLHENMDGLHRNNEQIKSSHMHVVQSHTNIYSQRSLRHRPLRQRRQSRFRGYGGSICASVAASTTPFFFAGWHLRLPAELINAHELEQDMATSWSIRTRYVGRWSSATVVVGAIIEKDYGKLGLVGIGETAGTRSTWKIIK